MVDRSCLEHETLISYVYGECAPHERQRVDAHLERCTACADELASLEGVRGALGVWPVPDLRLGVRLGPEGPTTPTPGVVSSWRKGWLTPAWSLAGAAALVVVVAAIASVEVRYDGEGFMFRIGWSTPAPNDESGSEGSASTISTSTSRAPVSADPLRRELIMLIRESERRQLQELASGLMSLAQEFDLQRREDQMRVQQDVDSLTDYVVRVVGR